MDMSQVDLKSISAAAKAAGITDPAALIAFSIGYASSQFQQTAAKFKAEINSLKADRSGTNSAPRFGFTGRVADVKPIPKTHQAAFKNQYTSSESKSYSSEFAKSISHDSAKVRAIQFARWRWAQTHMDIYINELRVKGFTDEQIQDMLDGCPLCFANPAEYKEFSDACAQLISDLEHGKYELKNVKIVVTGSSVPGFSQNPLKGITNQPSKITDTESSDVDLNIQADGMSQMINSLNLESGKFRMYPSTCSPHTSTTRIGLHPKTFKAKMPKCMTEFHAKWHKKLSGGLQLTFQDAGAELPPWEIVMPTEHVVAGHHAPLFGYRTKVADIKPIAEADKEAFKKEHLSSEYKKYSSDFAKMVSSNTHKCREIMYNRWRFAQQNPDIYVNSLRVKGFTDKQIQDMLDGCPLCFATPADYKEFYTACAELCATLEPADIPFSNIRVVVTGSSVPGFSQNPLKGITDKPSKITSPESSDVDICFVADGITDWVNGLKLTPKQHRMYPSCCTRNLSTTRIGFRGSTFHEVVPKEMSDFMKAWDKKLPGGLQITFQDSGSDLPPWEIFMPFE